MKTYSYVLAAALGIAIAVGTKSVVAAGADGWDALGAVVKLQNKVTALEARVAELERGGPLGDSLALQHKVIELERKLDTLERESGVTRVVVDEMPRADVQIPIQVHSQEEILQVFKRGMFVPAK
ncbi:MAG: hypothetical protein HUU46_01055 [Candidatus Hydrogenedentes bacterium]|nr:hypothetical protein [Candidatus Hydrogenedentota bacterium]